MYSKISSFCRFTISVILLAVSPAYLCQVCDNDLTVRIILPLHLIHQNSQEATAHRSHYILKEREPHLL